jgi:GGDEF domain-containing protein
MPTRPLEDNYPIKSLTTIAYKLEKLEKPIDSVFSVNAAKLRDYFDLYGPEQRDNAIKMMFDVLYSMEQKGSLLYHARYDLDKVITASIGNSIEEKAAEIRDTIKSTDIEIVDGLIMKDIDPKRIDVYVGAASGKMQLKDLIDLAIEAEKQAKTSSNKIYIKK